MGFDTPARAVVGKIVEHLHAAYGREPGTALNPGAMLGSDVSLSEWKPGGADAAEVGERTGAPG